MGFKQSLYSQFGRPRGFWGHMAGKIMASLNRERNDWVVSLLDIQQHDRVLEIGFGPGRAIETVSKLASDGFIAGLDYSDVMVRQACRRNAKAIHEGRVELKLASVSELPEFDEPFDKCFAVNTMKFWAEPFEGLKQLRRVLKPGGLIAIAEQPKSPGATDETAHVVGKEMAKMLTKAGFSHVRLKTKPMRPVAAVCVLGVNSPDASVR